MIGYFGTAESASTHLEYENKNPEDNSRVKTPGGAFSHKLAIT